VKRYVSEKARHLRERYRGDEHVLIVPGERDEMIIAEQARTYFIQSPLISRTSRYRVLLRLEAIERVFEKERPDLIESGDPYQCAWKAVHSGAALGIPVIGFYHSHFPEAYVRSVRRFFGETLTEFFVDISKRYVRNLYNRFERTIVPSPALGALLTEWGVRNVVHSDLGVDTSTFQPVQADGEDVRREFDIPRERTLLLYIGRLAQEKNTRTLFAAFRLLPRERFHLFVVGDGLQRGEVESFSHDRQSKITWLPYCAEPARLAAFYRAADLFVHPGVQETFGLVTLEAQACGTPVIGIRGSYMDRIVHSDEMSWAEANTPRALAEAILGAARRLPLHDREQLHARIAAYYSWDEVFARLFDVYREVIHNYRRP
jgi:alpha-1,6-mannosyltransferase